MQFPRKNLLIIIIFLSTYSSIYAQKPFQIEMFISPTYTNNNKKNNFVSNDFVTSYSGKLNYDLGISFRQFVGDKINVGFGVNYSKMGYKFRQYDTFPDGDVPLENRNTFRNKISRNYVEVPLLFELGLGARNKYLLDFNIVNQFLTSIDRWYMKYNSTTTIKGDELKENYGIYNIAVQTGITYEKRLNDNLSYRFSPFAKMALLENKDNSHDWSVGLKCGVAFNTAKSIEPVQKTATLLGFSPAFNDYYPDMLHVNILPFTFQKSLGYRVDIRVAPMIYLGVEDSKGLNQYGGELSFPIYDKRKDDITLPSRGFYIAPGVGFLTFSEVFQRSESGTNLDFSIWLEPGYTWLIAQKYSVNLGVEFGIAPNEIRGNNSSGHFKANLIIGKWF